VTRDANLVAAFSMAVAEAIDASTTEHVGLDNPVPAAFVTVYTRPDITIDDLRRVLALSHSGTVRIIDRIEVRALLTRQRRGRTVALRVTPEGARAAEEDLHARSRTVEALLDQLPVSSRRKLESAETALHTLSTGRTEARHLCRRCDQSTCAEGEGCPVDAAATQTERRSS
jgi:DNA-binding MarR family transcriptional regulator